MQRFIQPNTLVFFLNPYFPPVFSREMYVVNANHVTLHQILGLDYEAVDCPGSLPVPPLHGQMHALEEGRG